MNWALPISLALALFFGLYLLFLRNLRQARRAQAKADVLATALRQSPAVVGITDLDGNLEYVNPAFERASGYSERELLGQNPRVLKSGVTPDSHYRELWRSITSGEAWVSELCNKRKDGQLYWEWASIAPVVDRTGKTTHYVKVAEDITRRKLADAARADSERRFRSVFDMAGAGVALVDRQGRWLQVNDHLCEILGYAREELVGHSFLEITPPEDHDREDGWQETFASGRIRSAGVEKRYRTRAGSEVWVEVTATLVRDPLGVPEYYICLIQDLTRRKDAEAEAARQQSQLAHLARIHTLQQMASELAHEIHQPLCAVQAAAQALSRLLESEQPGALEDARQALTLITEQVARAGAVVGSVRQFSRKQSPERKVVPVDAAVQQALNLLGADLHAHRVRLQINREGWPEARVLMDPVLFSQVLVNLCRNGIDAMAAAACPDPVLTVGWSRQDDEVLIGVANTGPPLAAGLAERIFAPFFTTRPEGLGLGLSLSRSIAESSGGRLWVEPGKIEGTTFFLTLPVGRETDPESGGEA